MELDVKGQIYKVIYKKLEEHGKCSTAKHTIYIDSGKKTQGRIKEVTKAHELMHAYLAECYVADIISDDLEEVICEIVGNMVEKHIDFLNKG